MTYRKAIPLATERPSVSQPKIKENFTQINDQFGVDHTELEESTQQGKHKKVTLYEQATDPTTAADESAIYSKEGDNGTELYFRKENDGEVIKLVGLKVLAIASANLNGTLINDRFNVASCSLSVIAGPATKYRVTFTNALSNANYQVSVSAANGQTGVGMFYVVSKATTYVEVAFRDVDAAITRSGFDMFVYKV